MKRRFELKEKVNSVVRLAMRLLAVGVLMASPLCGGAENSPTNVAERKAVPTTFSPAKIATIGKVIQAGMKRQDNVVGLAVGIISDGRISYVNGFGYADLAKEIPVNRETMFRWASCAKSVTALTALQLVEIGKLDLAFDVRTYVPEFPDKGERITTRDLLCHQSGISHYGTNVVATKRTYPMAHPFEDVILGLDHFRETPLLGKPQEKYIYTTYGYMLLSAVVQRAGEDKFSNQVRDLVTRPLGMTTFQPDYQWINIPHRAIGYRKLGKMTIRSTDTDVSYKLGGGGFISNVDDFARFAQGLMDRRFMSEKSETLMWVDQKLSDGKSTRYGFGFLIRNQRSDPDFCVSHSGSQEKTKACFMIFPNAKRGVVVMSNSEWADPGAFCRLIDKVAQSSTADIETSAKISHD